ncbi:MAG: UPF0280 family protein [Pseudomonadota bacterium]
MTGVQCTRLSGDRQHFHHGPIDVILRAYGAPEAVERANAAAARAFPDILPTLCEELSLLRSGDPRLWAGMNGPVSRRMVEAVQPFAEADFVTPMAAVAGSVADELLAIMQDAAPIAAAYVNDGGDIAVLASRDHPVTIALDPPGAETLSMETPGGVATSGRAGRSRSLGVADRVTVIAATAATADVAATLIANAVTSDAPGIERVPASSLDPDHDLGERLVTVAVPHLSQSEVQAALAAGKRVAKAHMAGGFIQAARLVLQGQHVTVGTGLMALEEHAAG